MSELDKILKQAYQLHHVNQNGIKVLTLDIVNDLIEQAYNTNHSEA